MDNADLARSVNTACAMASAQDTLSRRSPEYVSLDDTVQANHDLIEAARAMVDSMAATGLVNPQLSFMRALHQAVLSMNNDRELCEALGAATRP
jgi:hypothetical protein